MTERDSVQDILIAHAHQLGELTAQTKTLTEQSTKLFDIARENQKGIVILSGEVQGVGKLLTNGLQKKLDELCSSMVTERDNLLREIMNNRKTVSEQYSGIELALGELRDKDKEINGKVMDLQVEKTKGLVAFLNESFKEFGQKLKGNRWIIWPFMLFLAIMTTYHLGVATAVVKYFMQPVK